jgi:DNA polymerase I-like protein with 3'-5' exonuclease and polymerase domains
LEDRRDAAVQEAMELFRRETEGVYSLAIPLIADAVTGKNWDEVH